MLDSFVEKKKELNLIIRKEFININIVIYRYLIILNFTTQYFIFYDSYIIDPNYMFTFKIVYFKQNSMTENTM